MLRLGIFHKTNYLVAWPYVLFSTFLKKNSIHIENSLFSLHSQAMKVSITAPDGPRIFKSKKEYPHPMLKAFQIRIAHLFKIPYKREDYRLSLMHI